MESFVKFVEDDHGGEYAREEEYEKQVNELYAEIGRLSAHLSQLKKSAFKLE